LHDGRESVRLLRKQHQLLRGSDHRDVHHLAANSVRAQVPVLIHPASCRREICFGREFGWPTAPIKPPSRLFASWLSSVRWNAHVHSSIPVTTLVSHSARRISGWLLAAGTGGPGSRLKIPEELRLVKRTAVSADELANNAAKRTFGRCLSQAWMAVTSSSRPVMVCGYLGTTAIRSLMISDGAVPTANPL